MIQRNNRKRLRPRGKQQCIHCEKVKPLDKYHFKRGLWHVQQAACMSTCRECENRAHREIYRPRHLARKARRREWRASPAARSAATGATSAGITSARYSSRRMASSGAQSFVTAICTLTGRAANLTNWVVVEDAAGNQLGPGDIRAREVSVTPKLDAAGRWSAVCIGSDRRALDLLQVNRVVRIYRQTHGNPAREIGAGIITTRQFVEDPGKHTLRVDGPDLLEELRRKTTRCWAASSRRTRSTTLCRC